MRLIHRAYHWLRGQQWLLEGYQQLPHAFRHRVRLAILARMHARLEFSRTPAWRRPLSADVPAAVEAKNIVGDGAGVNIYTYLHGQFGLAEAARMYIRALQEQACPITVHDVGIDIPHGMDDRSIPPSPDGHAPHPISLVFVNPDYLPQALEIIGEERLRGRHLIGFWFWELQDIPLDWYPALDLVDELMVATRFVEQALRRVTDKPVLRVPLPVLLGRDSGLSREDFGLAPDKFTFLCSFDFNSSIARKNPMGAINAFRKAFAPDRDDVRLLVKSSNGHRYPEQLHELVRAAGDDQRIMIRDEIIQRAHMQALLRNADAYVSLHRAEGFGMGLAESMMLGKPVIGTNWSGNLDFMNASNSLLVDYRLVPVGPSEYPHLPGAVWAEPDIGHAAVCMQRLVDEPGLAAMLGARARENIRAGQSMKDSANTMLERMLEIQELQCLRC